jgi:Flp pilus assembly protein TadD
MSESPRVDALRRMAEARPNDPRARFGLYVEYEKAGDWESVVEQLSAYLGMTADEGNAHGRLGHALLQLGRVDQARAAYAAGIQAAYRHGHPTMAQEFEEVLEGLD